jgi:alpha-tubulin suppressor-like RCC1 family protein
LAIIDGFPAGHKGKEGENEEERRKREEEERSKHGGEGKEGVFSVVAWGYNDDGQLGDGEKSGGPNHCWKTHLPCSEVPVPVCYVERTPGTPCNGSEGLPDASAVAAGGSHSLALVKGENVVAWGEATFGTLGNRQTLNSYAPMYVCRVGFTGTPANCEAGKYLKEVSAIAAGEFHNLALLDNGEVVAWGQNTSGQLGNGESGLSSAPETCSANGCSETPVSVCEVGYTGTLPCPGHLAGVTEVSAGKNHNLAVGNFVYYPVWYKNKSELPKGGARSTVATSGSLALQTSSGTVKCAV